MILLTGATGTTGGSLARLLIERGVPFRALVRDPGRAADLRRPGVELVKGDLAVPGTLDAAMAGVTRLFLLSGMATDQARIQQNAVMAAKRAGVGHVVKVSAIGAGRDSPLKLDRDHAEVEGALVGSGMAYTILRAHSFMQNLLTQTTAIAAKGEFYDCTGDGAVARVDTRDIAFVAAEVLTDGQQHEGRTYELTGPRAITNAEAADVLADAIGRPVSYVDLPEDAIRAALIDMGIPTWLADDRIALNAMYREGHGAAVSDAVSRILNRPATNFAKFARDYAEVFRGEG